MGSTCVGMHVYMQMDMHLHQHDVHQEADVRYACARAYVQMDMHLHQHNLHQEDDDEHRDAVAEGVGRLGGREEDGEREHCHHHCWRDDHNPIKVACPLQSKDVRDVWVRVVGAAGVLREPCAHLDIHDAKLLIGRARVALLSVREAIAEQRDALVAAAVEPAAPVD